MSAVLNIETGAGADSSCNSYVSLAEVTAYAEEMGNAAWALALASPDTARITAIIRACRAIDRLYGQRFLGRPANYATQAMAWPRSEALTTAERYLISNTSIPQEVKKACCEAALLELAEAGSMTPDLDRGGKIKSVSAGAVSVTFEDGATAQTVRTAIEGILRVLFKNTGNELELG